MVWTRPAMLTRSFERSPGFVIAFEYFSTKAGTLIDTWNLCGYGEGVVSVRSSAGMALSFWMALLLIS